MQPLGLKPLLVAPGGGFGGLAGLGGRVPRPAVPARSFERALRSQAARLFSFLSAGVFLQRPLAFIRPFLSRGPAVTCILGIPLPPPPPPDLTYRMVCLHHLQVWKT